MTESRPGAVVHRAGRRWRVQPGRPIRLLDGDVVEIGGRLQVVDLDEEPEGHASGVARHARGAAALALAAFLGVTSPASAETPSPPAAAQQPTPDDKEPGQVPAPTAAPGGKITGKVLFAGSKRPVIGITVIARSAQGDEKAALTDDHGGFELEGLKPGKYWVRAVPAGDVASAKERPALVKAGASVTVALTARRATMVRYTLGREIDTPPRSKK